MCTVSFLLCSIFYSAISNLRRGAAGVFFQAFLVPMRGLEVNVEMKKDAERILTLSLKVRIFCLIFLLHLYLLIFQAMEMDLQTSNFLVGNDPTIADLSAECELSQLEVLSYDFSPYPMVSAWRARVASLPHYEEVSFFACPLDYFTLILTAAWMFVFVLNLGTYNHSENDNKRKENVVIDKLEPVGNYAVRIVFDDGHDTGLYSWEHLYNLCKKVKLK